MKFKSFLPLVVIAPIGLCNHADAAFTADVVFIVDESGSMATEHTWLGSMITALESNLATQGVTGNRYGLVGFGGLPHEPSQLAHAHLVGGGDFGTAAEFSTATGNLITYGGWEDGWQAIDFAVNHYGFRSGAAVNFILVTDEDRDNRDTSLTYAGVLASLTANNYLLNAVVNASLEDGAGATALGINPTPDSYLADGLGGFTITPGGVVNSDWGTTETDYINMAHATGGAAWDLNQLRAGGVTAESFTAAFVDLKTEEIQQQQVVPEPTTFIGLSSLAFCGLVLALYRMRRR